MRNKNYYTLNGRKISLKEKRELRSPGEQIFLWALCALFAIYTITLFYPMIWTIINAFKTPKEFMKNIYGLPQTPTMENFKTALQVKVGSTNLIGMFFNSVIVTVAALVIAILECTMTGYIFSKYKFPGSKFIYSMMLVLMFLPLVGTTAGTFRFYVNTGLYDTRIGLILLYTGGFGGPFLYMYNFFEGVSWDYAEAAMIDGASDWQVFFKVMFPQSIGMQLAIAMMSFLGIYGDFTNPFLYTKSHPTLSVGIYTLTESLQAENLWPAAFAAMLVSCVPTWIFYMATNTKMFNLKIDTGIKG